LAATLIGGTIDQGLFATAEKRLQDGECRQNQAKLEHFSARQNAARNNL